MKQPRAILIQKSSGEREPFSEEKLRRSLVSAGASEEVAGVVIAHVLAELKDGMPTQAIYRHAFSILRRKARAVATTYSLRKAMIGLGPTGFPFEKFVAEVMRRHGYTAKTGVTIPGFCVSHEVDVLAEKDDRHIFVECKFHHDLATKSDVKVALYVHARFLDLQKGHAHNEANSPKIHEGWLVTNTKVTHDAVQYASCAGLTIIGWNYPEHGNLHDLIIESGVHPLTCLTTLSMGEKQALLLRGVVSCFALSEDAALLPAVGVPENRIARIRKEIAELCQSAGVRG